MNKLLLIYSAVIFIAGVILFTVSRLKKDAATKKTVITVETEEIGTAEDGDQENLSENKEFSKWLMVFSILLVIMAAACLILSFKK
ncbi:hypothetical protein [Butyrivibrio sp. YAB3001]|uniref:hypothetical protein n=1 Tax=Butyrivibrio sp. YAB3001 TaxID=1520812 RepID=UPI0008F68979|nr:hypothetical protein [Butyrivibrio sp. YAB3001]SFC73754.1 hypothetical protein SAMN02910398_03016 [Butyrivibrio sp. YAB3001]